MGRLGIRVLVVIAVLGAGVGLAAPPSAATPARWLRPDALTTPERITRAERAGAINPDEAFVLRLKALRGKELPGAYRSSRPWHGTGLVLQMREYLEHGGHAKVMARGPLHPVVRLLQPVLGLLGLQPGAFDCAIPESPQLRGYDTEHFHFQYPRERLGGGLFLRDYAEAFEKAWRDEIDRFGWAAPPVAKGADFNGRYLVVIDMTMQGGLYGVTAGGDTVGDNPATPWNDGDAQSSCIVINGRFDRVSFASEPRAALEATAAHEFFHAIQYGMGTLDKDPANLMLVEATATWMEDEVFDGANDSYNFLWPNLDENMATHSSSVYGYFVVFRHFAERIGASRQTFIRDLFELVSQRRARDVHAVVATLSARGLQFGQAFHDVGIAVSVLRPCGGAYALPHCFEEADGYKAVAGPLRTNGVLRRGTTSDDTVEDDLAMKRFALPAAGGNYTVTVTNRDDGGVLRVSAVCDTGKGLRISSVPGTLGAAASGRVSVSPDGCSFVRLVVSNEAVSKGIPTSVPARDFRVVVS